MKVSARDVKALIDALVAWERVKPGQVGKRVVFEKYGIRGTVKDYVFTAVIYKLERKRGLIDKVLAKAGIREEELDEYSKAFLRLFVYEKMFGKGESTLLNALVKHGPRAVEELTRGVSKASVLNNLLSKLRSITYQPQDFIEELEFRYSAPYQFIKKVIELIGLVEAERFFKAVEELKYISFRINTLKTTVEEGIRKLEEEGYEVQVGRLVPFVVKLKGPFDYANSRAFREGLLVPQDEASALAALLLNPEPGELVVDLCAAPGGKTTHMGELMGNKGRIIAIELYEDRARRLKYILEKTGITIAQVYVMDGRDTPDIIGEEIADKVLLDPPCSSTGALIKSPEAKWRYDFRFLEDLVDRQRKLLRAAIKLLKPGGYLLYTTCSILREENEDNVVWALNKYEDCLKLVEIHYPGLDPGFIPGTLRTWPHKHETSGFFYALLQKIKSCKTG